MPATLNRPGRKPSDIIEDRGCWAAPTCAGCPWRECVMLMAPSERRIFRLAFRTLESFRAPPDRAIEP